LGDIGGAQCWFCHAVAALVMGSKRLRRIASTCRRRWRPWRGRPNQRIADAISRVSAKPALRLRLPPRRCRQPTPATTPRWSWGPRLDAVTHADRGAPLAIYAAARSCLAPVLRGDASISEVSIYARARWPVAP